MKTKWLSVGYRMGWIACVANECGDTYREWNVIDRASSVLYLWRVMHERVNK